MNKDLLLQAYGALYGPEAGPWNLSAEQKYLEYRITQFFEENFSVPEGADLCNVGIGAGYWDRYLSYRLRGGTLTSIDKNPLCCCHLEAGLANEGNPNRVIVVPKDVMDCGDLAGRFDIVTMVGTTRQESGLFEDVLEMLFRFLKPGGSLYYQSLDQQEEKETFEALCCKNEVQPTKFLLDYTFGRKAHYWQVVAKKI